ncbi:MAG: ATP-binding protein [Candidatus Dormibacteria bacterium]|jgi:signal transduction histidine kinase
MRDRRFFTLVAAAVGFSLFSAFWITTHAHHDPGTVAFDDISESAAALLAALACYVAARNRRTEARRTWGLMGVAALLWGLGQAAWTVQEVVLHENPQNLFPSWPDLGFLSSIPFAIAGLLALPVLGRSALKVQFFLDAVLVAGGVLFVSWATVLGPLYASSSTGLVQQVLSLAYPIGDVFMISIVLLALSRVGGSTRHTMLFLGLGLGLNAVADSTFAYLTTVRSYDTENPVNVGWTLGYLLIGLAALRALNAARQAPEAKDEQVRWRTALPYVPVLAAGVVAAITQLRGTAFDSLMLWDGFAIVAVVLMRQFILVRDTQGLDSRLQEQNLRLDELVRERTRALDETLGGLRHANDESRGLLLRMVTLQDEERRRLSVIIHDDMLQWMTVGHTRLQIAQSTIAEPRLAAAVTRADEAVRGSITRMRGLMSELHPQIAERGFTQALRDYLEQVQGDGDLHCSLDGRFAEEPTGTVATTLYRITCEAVVNARKHAAGSNLVVELSDPEAGYAICIRDDGPGFLPEGGGYSPTGHVGLTSMRERAEALGGWWSLESQPGEGTCVKVCVPREAAASPPSDGSMVLEADAAAQVMEAALGSDRREPLVTLDGPLGPGGLERGRAGGTAEPRTGEVDLVAVATGRPRSTG